LSFIFTLILHVIVHKTRELLLFGNNLSNIAVSVHSQSFC